MEIVVLSAKCLQIRFIDTQSNAIKLLKDVGNRRSQIYLDHYPVRIILWSLKTSHPVTPIVKLVKSTSAKLLILVLEDVYDTSGNPIRQKCDNGPPLNSKKMENFAKNRNNEQFKTPPGHFSSNNVETVMKPLGIVMKISQFQNQGKKGTLSSFL